MSEKIILDEDKARNIISVMKVKGFMNWIKKTEKLYGKEIIVITRDMRALKAEEYVNEILAKGK
jgi:energy-coupling factor transporter ATP-binding protein EcfA2